MDYGLEMAQMVKNLPAMWETWVLSLGWGDPLEEGMATHCSVLAWRILMDRGAWQGTVHGITKGQTRLSEKAQANAGDTRSILGREDPLRKEMATQSSILAWEIPWTEDTKQSMRWQSQTQLNN